MNGDGVEGLEVVNESERLTVLFEHTEPARLVSCGGRFVHTGGDAVLDDLNSLVPGRWGNGNIAEDPGGVRYGRYLNRWEVLVV